MPITYGCFIVGGLALSGIPPFSGFFSKDDILLGIGELGGWHWILYVGGYIGALMTAVYTFRMIFRAFHGDPCEEAKSLEDGRLYHAPEHRNPADGTLEDTEVGFPGSKHHIAERSISMAVAMGVLAFLATTAGVLQIPKVSHVMESFLEPTFVGSPHFGAEIDTSLLLFGMGLGTVLGLLGIWIAWTLYVKRPGSSAAIEARFAGPHKLFANKWYFDEAIDFAIVRPFAALGRFGQRTVERVVVDGGITGGPVSIARVSSAAVRASQSGLLRSYAAAGHLRRRPRPPLLPAAGLTGDPLDPDRHPLRSRPARAAVRRARAGEGRVAGRLARDPDRRRDAGRASTTPLRRGLSSRDRQARGSQPLGIHWALASTASTSPSSP